MLTARNITRIEDAIFILMGIGTAGLCVRCIGYWVVT